MKPEMGSDAPESPRPAVSFTDAPSPLSRLWERHKNPLSWFARPLFGATLFYGAWVHSGWLLALGFVGVTTSWFWFPKPRDVPRWIERFIDIERSYLSPPWTSTKVFGFAVTLFFVAFTIAAFWKRHLDVALGIVMAGCLVKAVWSIAVARGAAMGAVIFGLASAAGAALVLMLA